MPPLPCLWPGQDKGMSKGAKHSKQPEYFLSEAGGDVFLFGGSPWWQSLTFLGKKLNDFFFLNYIRAETLSKLSMW